MRVVPRPVLGPALIAVLVFVGGLSATARNRLQAAEPVQEAGVTERFGPYCDLYLDMLNKQLTFDALKLLGFDLDVLTAMGTEMVFLRDLAHRRKIAQARVVARKAP